MAADELSLFLSERAMGDGERRTSLEKRSGGPERGDDLTKQREDDAILSVCSFCSALTLFLRHYLERVCEKREWLRHTQS